MVLGLRSRKGDSGDGNIEPVVVNDSSSEKHGLEDAKSAQPERTELEHSHLTDEQAARRLKLFREAAENDPNIDVDDLGAVDYAVDGHDVNKENQLVDELMENSPYPEVCTQCESKCFLYGPSLSANHVSLRFALRFETMTLTCRPTRFEPGLSGCS